MSRRRRFRPRVWLWAMVAGWLGFALGPYVWMLLTSIKPTRELYRFPVQYFPHHPTLRAYGLLLHTTPFPEFMAHSLIVAASTVLMTLLLALPAAFSLSRHRFRGKKAILSILVSVQFFPSVLLVLSLFPILRALDLLNTLVGLVVVYTAFVTPFSVWLLKGFFDGIPTEVDEAALVDGCSEVRALRHVLMPIVVPGVVAAATYIFIFSWNEFLFALTFTSSNQARTLPIGLDSFIGNFLIRWNLLTAGGVISAIPIFLFFLLVQRRLISGLAAGAVKG